MKIARALKSGSSCRVVLLDEGLDRLGLDPRLRRVVHAARQVAVSADGPDQSRPDEGVTKTREHVNTPSPLVEPCLKGCGRAASRARTGVTLPALLRCRRVGRRRPEPRRQPERRGPDPQHDHPENVRVRNRRPQLPGVHALERVVPFHPPGGPVRAPRGASPPAAARPASARRRAGRHGRGARLRGRRGRAGRRPPAASAASSGPGRRPATRPAVDRTSRGPAWQAVTRVAAEDLAVVCPAWHDDRTGHPRRPRRRRGPPCRRASCPQGPCAAMRRRWGLDTAITTRGLPMTTDVPALPADPTAHPRSPPVRPPEVRSGRWPLRRPARRRPRLRPARRRQDGVVPRVPLRDRRDLSLAYTPGVAEVCEAIAAEPDLLDALHRAPTPSRSSPTAPPCSGSATSGPALPLPVMEGKARAVQAVRRRRTRCPICLDTTDVDEIVETVARLAPSFGGINLEDISAPRCFEIERRLKERLDIPVFHDDQHGTAVVVARRACRTPRSCSPAARRGHASWSVRRRGRRRGGRQDPARGGRRATSWCATAGRPERRRGWTCHRTRAAGVADDRRRAGARARWPTRWRRRRLHRRLRRHASPRRSSPRWRPDAIDLRAGEPRSRRCIPRSPTATPVVVATGRSRLPQPDQQRAGLPGHLPRRLRRRGDRDHRGHEARRRRRASRTLVDDPSPRTMIVPSAVRPSRGPGRGRRGRRGRPRRRHHPLTSPFPLIRQSPLIMQSASIM